MQPGKLGRTLIAAALLAPAGMAQTAPEASPVPPERAEVAAESRLDALARRILAEDEEATRAAEAAMMAAGALGTGDVIVEQVLSPETDGLKAARARGYLRMAVAPDPLMISFDGEEAIGAAIGIADEMEKYLATLPDASPTPTVVVPTPVPRSEIVDALETGATDFTTLTVTRAEENPALGYTSALIEDVNDVPVLAPDIEGVETLDDLTRIPLYVSEGGRYAPVLERLNAEREAAGQTPFAVKYVDRRLDDYDLIEMVQVGLIPATVALDFKARFWAQVYPSVVIREDLELTRDGRIAWAVRTENEELRDALDGFAATVKQGTLLGNVMLERYVASADWIVNLSDAEARNLIDEVFPVIARHAQSQDFDPELVLAQAYQESRLDQSKVSHAGARGVMQVMPATAADPVVAIPDISSVENNVAAGIKYLRWLSDNFFDEPGIDPLDRTLLTFAAYNAGPGGVKKAQRLAVEMGLDPNVWFENVEVAIQRAVSREPAVYVRNIFKYYVAYRLLRDLEEEAEPLRAEVEEAVEAAADLPAEEAAEVLETTTDIVVGENEAAAAAEDGGG